MLASTSAALVRFTCTISTIKSVTRESGGSTSAGSSTPAAEGKRKENKSREAGGAAAGRCGGAAAAAGGRRGKWKRGCCIITSLLLAAEGRQRVLQGSDLKVAGDHAAAQRAPAGVAGKWPVGGRSAQNPRYARPAAAPSLPSPQRSKARLAVLPAPLPAPPWRPSPAQHRRQSKAKQSNAAHGRRRLSLLEQYEAQLAVLNLLVHRHRGLELVHSHVLAGGQQGVQGSSRGLGRKAQGARHTGGGGGGGLASAAPVHTPKPRALCSLHATHGAPAAARWAAWLPR